MDLSDGLEATSEGDEDDIVCVYDQQGTDGDPNESRNEDFEGETDAEYDEEISSQNDFTGTDESVSTVGSRQVLVNVAHPREDPEVLLSEKISRAVKPHQVQGIRFLYSNIVENFIRYN